MLLGHSRPQCSDCDSSWSPLLFHSRLHPWSLQYPQWLHPRSLLYPKGLRLLRLRCTWWLRFATDLWSSPAFAANLQSGLISAANLQSDPAFAINLRSGPVFAVNLQSGLASVVNLWSGSVFANDPQSGLIFAADLRSVSSLLLTFAAAFSADLLIVFRTCSALLPCLQAVCLTFPARPPQV